ncbi:hypothetical protein E4U59_005805, partial [Claviceps monticola]
EGLLRERRALLRPWAKTLIEGGESRWVDDFGTQMSLGTLEELERSRFALSWFRGFAARDTDDVVGDRGS